MSKAFLAGFRVGYGPVLQKEALFGQKRRAVQGERDQAKKAAEGTEYQRKWDERFEAQEKERRQKAASSEDSPVGSATAGAKIKTWIAENPRLALALGLGGAGVAAGAGLTALSISRRKKKKEEGEEEKGAKKGVKLIPKEALFGQRRRAAEANLSPSQRREQKVLAHMRGTSPPRQLSTDEGRRAAKLLAIVSPESLPKKSSGISKAYAGYERSEHNKRMDLLEQIVTAKRNILADKVRKRGEGQVLQRALAQRGTLV
jgi:hypothetical protein